MLTNEDMKDGLQIVHAMPSGRRICLNTLEVGVGIALSLCYCCDFSTLLNNIYNSNNHDTSTLLEIGVEGAFLKNNLDKMAPLT